MLCEGEPDNPLQAISSLLDPATGTVPNTKAATSIEVAAEPAVAGGVVADDPLDVVFFLNQR